MNATALILAGTAVVIAQILKENSTLRKAFNIFEEPCEADPSINWTLDILEDENQQQRTNPCVCFSNSYEEARSRFQDAANGAGATLSSLAVDESESYTMDIAVVRGLQPGLVVHVSGTHGVEGFAGSAIQIAFLRALTNKAIWQKMPTVVFVHSFNPIGMAKFRRTNENNVDLNRNGLDDWSKLPNVNYDNYERFRPVFHPIQSTTWWTVNVSSWLQLVPAILKNGVPTLKAAMVVGQYHEPAGIFYGGMKQETSFVLLDEWMREFLQNGFNEKETAVTWVDVHTGLGAIGEDTLLPPTFGQAIRSDMPEWFPDSHSFSAHAKSVAQGYEQVNGIAIDYYQRNFFPNDDNGKDRHLFFAQEFGTLPSIVVGHHLVVENSAYHDPSLSERERLEWSRLTVGAAFYPASSQWRAQVLQRGLLVLTQAIYRSLKLSTAKP